MEDKRLSDLTFRGHTEGQTASSNFYKLRHLLFLTAILLDAGIIAISVALYKIVVYLSLGTLAQEWQARLPAFASVIGSLIASLNSLALTWIIISYTKKLSVTRGFNFKKLERLNSVAMGSIPLTFHPLLFFAIILLAAKAFIPSVSHSLYIRQCPN